jgi:nitronate monooxygenase
MVPSPSACSAAAWWSACTSASRLAQKREELAAYGPRYAAAFAAGDPDKAGVWVGEATGLIADIPPAGEIVARIMREAEACLARGRAAVV